MVFKVRREDTTFIPATTTKVAVATTINVATIVLTSFAFRLVRIMENPLIQLTALQRFGPMVSCGFAFIILSNQVGGKWESDPRLCRPNRIPPQA